jgi:hypothetical protein
VLNISGKVIGAGQPAIDVVFPLAFLWKVAMFALFQCFSIFQSNYKVIGKQGDIRTRNRK